jgi:hypothetical protein
MKDNFSELQKMLAESYPKARYQHLRKLQMTLLGFDDKFSESFADTSEKGYRFTHYAGLTRGAAQYQRANRILNNIRILCAQTRAVEIVPEWVNVADDMVGEARRAWWMQRAQGIGGYGGWKDDLDRAFMDFAALGLGVLRLCVQESANGDRACAKYRNPLHVLTDPYAMSPEESEWVVDADIWGLEAAKERFPKFDFSRYLDTYFSNDDSTLQGVRILEYYCKNPKKGMPGYMAIAQDLEGEVIEFGENPFGNLLPFGFFMNFQPPGASFPIGLVEMQSYAARRIEQIDELVKVYAERGTQVAVDPELLDADAWKRMRDGENPRYVALHAEKVQLMASQGRQPFMQIPRDTAPNDLYQERGMWEQFLRESSGVSSAMAGIVSPERRTATEITQVANQSAAQTAFLSREFARGLQNFASKMGEAAKRYDQAPFYVVVDGLTVEFNRDDRRLSSAVIWDGSLTAIVGESDLIKTDVNAKRQMEGGKWMQIFQLTQSPEALKQWMISQDIKNPEKYLPQPPPPSPGAGGPVGLPGGLPGGSEQVPPELAAMLAGGGGVGQAPAGPGGGEQAPMTPEMLEALMQQVRAGGGPGRNGPGSPGGEPPLTPEVVEALIQQLQAEGDQAEEGSVEGEPVEGEDEAGQDRPSVEERPPSRSQSRRRPKPRPRKR